MTAGDRCKLKTVIHVASFMGITAASAIYTMPAQAQSAVKGVYSENYPDKPIRWLVGFAPGGGTTITSRLVAQKLTDRLGKSVVVDNRPGAEGQISMEVGKSSPADGYTIVVLTTSMVVKYDVLTDFVGVNQMTAQPYFLSVGGSSPIKSVADLVAAAKANPGTLTYGSSGIGSMEQLGMELFDSLANVKLNHVPYKGSGPALVDLLGGHISSALTSTTSAATYIKSGQLRALAITTSKRSPIFPDLPTISESGVPGYDVSAWYGVMVHKNTPRNLIEKINAEITAVLQMDDIKSMLASGGAEASPMPYADFQTKIVSETKKWRDVVTRSGIKID